MLLSRGLNIVKTGKLLRSRPLECLNQVRNSHGPWSYRAPAEPPSKTMLLLAEGVQGFAWWWVLWHLYTEPGHIFGEFDYPDPRKWTDEELGVPPI